VLDLSDPLLDKLDAAFRDEHIPTLLSALAVAWNDDTANSLFGELWHQHSCYGATYAAVPHLLKIAEPEENRHQRREIALFLGLVALDSRRPRANPDSQSDGVTLQGLPETLDGWDRKLDCYRSLVAMLERPDRARTEYELTESLPHYREILASELVNASDLEKILTIKADFFSALPAIRALGERALLENLEETDAVRYLLSGIAAADGLLDLARLLHYGDDGLFECGTCGWGYEFGRFGERIAVYAEEADPHRGDGKSLSDYRDGAPSRADGFMVPVTENDVLDARTAALLSLAARAPEPALLARHFAGTFPCCKCAVQGRMRAV
jgi:hypothetical protein